MDEREEMQQQVEDGEVVVEGTGEVIPVTPPIGSAISAPIASAEALKQLEDGLELYQRFLSIVAKLTKPSHWVRRGDTFSLRATGAEALANPFQIGWGQPEIVRKEWTDALGKIVSYEVRGKIWSRLLGREGWFMGYCDTRDQFFWANARAQAIRQREKETGRSRSQFTEEDQRAVDAYTPAFISPGNVKKKAFSNWIATGIARLIGLRDPSEQLLRDAGIDIDAIPTIDYGGKKKGSSTTSGASSSQKKTSSSSGANGGTLSEQQRKMFWGRLFDKCKNNKDAAYQAANEICNKYGVKKADDLPAAKFDAILRWIDNLDIPF